MRIGTLLALAAFAAAPALARPQDPEPQTEKKAAKPAEPLADYRKGARNEGPDNRPPYDRLNEYGTLPASTFHDGGMYLPPEERVPEVFQYLRPDQQIRQGKLLGSQLPPVLLEFKILTKLVRPGEEVRATARIAAVNKPRPFASLFTHQEYGRQRAAVYLNFEPSKKDPALFLGRTVLPRWLAAGRYNIADTIIGDDNGHRKAYWSDWNPVLQEPDGTSVHFVVPENPDEDIRAPRLRRVEVAEQRVRVGQNIHLDVWVEDDRSGPSEVHSYWISPTRAQSVRSALVHVPTEPGRFKASFPIPEFYEGGAWQLLSLRVSDKATNTADLFSVSVPMLKDVTLLVDQDPAKVDKEAPRLLAVQLSHDEIARDKEVAITLLAEDDLSGMKEVYISFLAPYGADFNRVKLTNESADLRRRSASQQPNVFNGTLKLKPTQEPGEWRVSRINLADNANNYRNYNAVRDEMLKGLKVVFVDPRMKKKDQTETSEVRR